MPVSVRMDADLVAALEVEAQRRGITRSRLIVESVELALGRRDPHRLLVEVQREMKTELDAERKANRRKALAEDGSKSPGTGELVRSALKRRRVSSIYVE
jgi:predicted transcriptional regulator